MQKISRKSITIIIIVSILFAFMLSVTTFFERSGSLENKQAWNDNLPGIRIVGIVYALYCLLIPLMLYKKLLSVISKPDITPQKVLWRLIALRFAPLVGPIIGGQILVPLGMGLPEFVGYVAACIMGILVWGAITLRGK